MQAQGHNIPLQPSPLLIHTNPLLAGVLEIERVPCLSDNYSWLLHEPSSGATAAVDPAEVAPVLAALQARGWTLSHILNSERAYAGEVGGW